MTKRDWIFILIIVSLVQGIIWYISFVNANNSSALSYVSFAGTLISIILAVLAIGYTYGESLGQKNKSDTISNQIQVLNEVIKNVKIETESLNKISSINDELLQLSKVFDEGITNTYKKVDDVKSSIDKLLKDNENFSSKKEVVPNTIDKTVLARLLLSARNPLMEISLLALYSQKNTSHKHSASIYRSVATFIESAKKKVTDDNKVSVSDDIEELFVGAMISTHTLLEGAGLVSYKENKLTFDSSLENEIRNTIISSPKKSGEFYALLREEIVQRL